MNYKDTTVDIIERLEKRAEIRRQEGQPDRIADLLEEATEELRRLKDYEHMFNALWGRGR